MKTLCFADREGWRAWLAASHATSEGVWLRFAKGGKTGLAQREAVEEALCFGWIDSQLRSLGDEGYVQRFTPRRPRSTWSALNKRRVARLIESGRMTEAGLLAIERAKRDGSWDTLTAIEQGEAVPAELEAALATSARARAAFDAAPPSYRKQVCYLVSAAKTAATRARRVAIAIFALEEGIRFDQGTRISELEAQMKQRRA